MSWQRVPDPGGAVYGRVPCPGPSYPGTLVSEAGLPSKGAARITEIISTLLVSLPI